MTSVRIVVQIQPHTDITEMNPGKNVCGTSISKTNEPGTSEHLTGKASDRTHTFINCVARLIARRHVRSLNIKKERPTQRADPPS